MCFAQVEAVLKSKSDENCSAVVRVSPKAAPGDLRQGMALLAPGVRVALTRAAAVVLRDPQHADTKALIEARRL